jgi:flavin reductase (DIM6/NTAB) family NADH-FMN oxidoreductase RutF
MPADSEQLKRVLSHLPGGVTIVTSLDEEGSPQGLTAISVCSVSLDPPLVLACIERSTNTHAAIEVSRVFGVNFLGAVHRELADRFSSVGEKFEGVEHAVHLTGAPILTEAVASCDCTVVVAVPAGDHTIFVGRVEALRASQPPVAAPLIRYRGRYETLEPSENDAMDASGDPE